MARTGGTGLGHPPLFVDRPRLRTPYPDRAMEQADVDVPREPLSIEVHGDRFGEVLDRFEDRPTVLDDGRLQVRWRGVPYCVRARALGDRDEPPADNWARADHDLRDIGVLYVHYDD